MLRCRSVAEIRANLDRMQIPYEPAAIEALVAAADKKRRLRAEPDGPVEFYNDKVRDSMPYSALELRIRRLVRTYDSSIACL